MVFCKNLCYYLLLRPSNKSRKSTMAWKIIITTQYGRQYKHAHAPVGE